MVKYVPDRTGRFSQRPHYAPKELDRECENIIAGFLKERHGAAKYPVSTDDLTVLIERDDRVPRPVRGPVQLWPQCRGARAFPARPEATCEDIGFPGRG